MHTVTDLASVKTAVRQMSSRLEAEAAFTRQWMNLTRNRGYVDVSSELEGAAESIERAVESVNRASELVFEEQEKERTEQ